MKYIYSGIPVLFIFLLFSLNGFAQRSSGLMIDGTITLEEGNPDNVIIEMYEDGKKAPDYGINSSGKFKVELNYNHKFELIFKREGNFQQKIVVETTVPKAVLDTDPRFPPFPVNINLFKEIPGVDASFSGNTVLKIYYSTSVDNFIQELYYNDAQIAKLIEQAVLTGQQIDRRAEYMSKLTRAELAELRKEYNELLEQAGKEYAEEKFLDALDGYKAASQIFQDEQFPKDRIAEINDLLGLIMVAEELDKAMIERFNKLVKDGDLQFGQQKYTDAKKSYDRALSIKPYDEYVNSQLEKIAQIQKQQHLEEEYTNLLASGDKALKELLYNEAIGQFQSALELKPNEVYPKNKINEINGLLANQREDQEKQQNYDEAMKEGERQFSKQFFDRALTAFENALSYRPNDISASRRISETKEIMQGILDQMAFDKFIAEADKAYKKGEFSEALSNYEEALALVPDEPRTKKRVEEIRQIIQAQQSIDGYISQADKQFDQQKYLEAKTLYERARELDSKNKHVSDRLLEITQLLAGQELDIQYNETLASADSMLKDQDYENASKKYNEALNIKPKESYPKDKIAEIGAILAGISKTNSDYQSAISNADRLFEQKKYDDAKTAFADARRIKPDETYPTDMLVKIDSLVADQQRLAREAAEAEAARLAALQAEKDRNYADAIARADNLFNEENYENSRNEYRSALTIKPEESYPQQRIDEIGNLLAQLSAAQKAYEDAISRGDREFSREGWDAAIVAYNDAKNAKADEVYPDEQLAKIDSIITTRERLAREAAEAEAARLAALQAEKDRNYADAIARADNLFNEENYENSRNEYRSALTIKPEESYPQQRIDEIGNLMAQLSAAQKAYEDAISRGDREFSREGWDAAIVAYNDAKNAKADEVYPDEQLAKIDSIVTTRERLAREAAEAEAARLAALQAEKDKNYADAIARADNLFNEQNYENSRNEYRSALTINPEESYPQQRIDEIGNLLAQLSAAQKAYEDAISRGDLEFSREGWDAAIVAYNDAKNAKADEVYPDEQLSKIDSIVTTRERLAREAAEAEAARLAALQAGKDKNYADAIARADNLFNEQNYENSRNEYRSALTIKPEESYPQQRIDEIGNLMAQLSAAQKAYEDAVAKGDREFRGESWDAAIVAYNDAKNAKADEVYPDEQLAKIDSIVTTRERLAREAAEAEAARLADLEAEKDKNYADAIARADNLFNEQNYENSRNEYRSALTIKPEESYPQQRIDEIGNLLAQLSAAQKAYEDAISRGDREFSREGWDAAIVAYNDAKNAKADEVYPDEQLSKIDSIVTTRERLAREAAEAEAARLAALQAEKDKNYADAIARADNLFNEQNYENSRNEYRSALTIKPEESYPQERLSEIDRILKEMADAIAAREAVDRQYASLIQQADRLFSAKSYNPSKENYQKAVELKPEESYPKEKITEIDDILTQQFLDEKYRNIIVAADGLFRTQKYDDARLQYEIALGVKAEEEYPKSQIRRIDEIKAQEEARKNAEVAAVVDIERRRSNIAKMQEDLDEQKILEESGINALYDQLIQKADAFFDDTQYNVSRAWYYKALDLKPEEAYPQQRIDEINRLLNGMMMSQRDREYQRFIDLADNTFRENELAVSRGWYNQAIGQKPDEQYPKDQLAEIERLVQERLQGRSAERVAQFNETAKKAFDSGDLNVARFWYKKALELNPDDETAKAGLVQTRN